MMVLVGIMLEVLEVVCIRNPTCEIVDGLCQGCLGFVGA